MYKIGDKVKITRAGYRFKHRDDVGTIINIFNEDPSDLKIRWPDNSVTYMLETQVEKSSC